MRPYSVVNLAAQNDVPVPLHDRLQTHARNLAQGVFHIVNIPVHDVRQGHHAVARKQDAVTGPILHRDLEKAGAQDMASLGQLHRHPVAEGDDAAVGDGLKISQRVDGIGIGIKRQGGTVFGKSFFGGVFGVFFLQVSGVREQDLAQLYRGFAGKDAAAKPILDEEGDITAMIDVGMGQENTV